MYWTRDSKVMGDKAYALHWKAGESYPFTWCAERITNGDEDSVWIKYTVLNDPNWKQHSSGVVTRSKKLVPPHSVRLAKINRLCPWVGVILSRGGAKDLPSGCTLE